VSFDAGAIEATLTLDRTAFQRELAAAIAEGEAYANKRFAAKLGIDPQSGLLFRQEMSTLDRQLTRDAQSRMQTGSGSLLATLLGLSSPTVARQGVRQQQIAAREWAQAEDEVAQAAARAGAAGQAAGSQAASSANDARDAVTQEAAAYKLMGDQAAIAAAKAQAARASWSSYFAQTTGVSTGAAAAGGGAAGGAAGGGRQGGGGTGFWSGFLANAGGKGGGGGYGWGALTTRFPLFGGTGGGAGSSFLGLNTASILAGVAAWHLIADAILEVTAVVIPATAAVIAFGVAGSDAFVAIYKQIVNVHTVMDATGASIYPFNRALENLHATVQPMVWQLYGDAIVVASKKSGEFQQVALSTGGALDYLAARATVAMTVGGGMSVFMKHASSDFLAIGNTIGNVFGALGAVLKVLPGYAEMLLAGFEGFTHVIENIMNSGFTEQLLNWGLYAHGAVIWFGFLATIIARLVPFALTGFAKIAGSIASWLPAGGRANAMVGGLSKNFTTLSNLPWGWIAVAAAGIGFLTYKLLTAKDATQQWTDSLQTAYKAMPAIQGFTALQSAQTLVTLRLADAHRTLADATTQANANWAKGTQDVLLYNAQLSGAKAQVKDYNDAQSQMSDQAQLYTRRLGMLSQTYHGTNEAQGLLVASGVTLGQMLDKNSNQWEIIKARVQATYDSYQAMGQVAGQLGADIQVLNYLADDNVTAIQKLNQAWDQFTTMVVAGQTGLDAWLIAIKQLPTGANLTKVAFNGISSASLTFNQNLEQTIPQMRTMLDFLNQAAIGQDSYSRAVKDMMVVYLPYLKNNSTLLTQLKAISGGVIPDNVVSYQDLVNWLGKSATGTDHLSKAERDLKTIFDVATGSISNMSAAIQDQLMGAMENALANTPKLKTDVQHLNDMIQAGNAPLSAIHAAWQTVIGDLTSAGTPLKERQKDIYNLALQIGFAKDQEDLLHNTTQTKTVKDLANIASGFNLGTKATVNYIHQLTGIPKSVITKILETASGTGKVSVSMTSSTNPYPGGISGRNAGGGYITTGRGPTSDDNIVAVSRGELIVPTHIVSSGAVDHLRGMIPGFAAGGYPGYSGSGTSATSPYPGAGKWGVGFYDNFYKTVTNDLVNATKTSLVQAMQQAAAQAAAMSRGGGPSGPGTHAALPYLEALWREAGGPAGVAHLMAAIAMAESGGNPNAYNPSGASGLWQILGLPFPGNPFNPLTNARMAVSKYFSQGLGAWVTYTSGAYRAYYDKGGALPQGSHFVTNTSGGTEEVLSPSERAAFVALAKSFAPNSEPGLPPGSSRLEAKIDQLISAVNRAAGRTGVATAQVLNGMARGAAAEAFYAGRT
jgi:transglycosylase-like protein with SLT domain